MLRETGTHISIPYAIQSHSRMPLDHGLIWMSKKCRIVTPHYLIAVFLDVLDDDVV
jgi:hypothetical protein